MVFLVVTQLNGREGAQGEVVTPAPFEIKKFTTGKKNNENHNHIMESVHHARNLSSGCRRKNVVSHTRLS